MRAYGFDEVCTMTLCDVYSNPRPPVPWWVLAALAWVTILLIWLNIESRGARSHDVDGVHCHIPRRNLVRRIYEK